MRHIVIGMNPSKVYPVSPLQRKEIIEQALPSIGATNAQVARLRAISRPYHIIQYIYS